MIDARGLSCPMPVVMVQKAIQKSQPATLEVLVDAKVAVENITRFAQSQGYRTSTTEQGPDFKMTLKKGEQKRSLWKHSGLFA